MAKKMRGEIRSPKPSSKPNQNGWVHFACFTLGLNTTGLGCSE